MTIRGLPNSPSLKIPTVIRSRATGSATASENLAHGGPGDIIGVPAAQQVGELHQRAWRPTHVRFVMQLQQTHHGHAQLGPASWRCVRAPPCPLFNAETGVLARCSCVMSWAWHRRLTCWPTASLRLTLPEMKWTIVNIRLKIFTIVQVTHVRSGAADAPGSLRLAVRRNVHVGQLALLEVVWSLPLQVGSEGPTLISNAASNTSSA